ncbi:MAG: homoserine O-acetyltransferase [Haloferacaceae archaeon]
MTRVEQGTRSLGEFRFECGESIPDLEVAYEAYGEFDGDNAVLLCHALTGSQNVAPLGDDNGTTGQARAWWGDIVGPGKAIDTNDYYVVCANVPGSCYGTSGPPTTNPQTGEPYGTAFPPVTVRDWTRAQRRLLDDLGVGRLHAVAGGSVGGMNALDWAVAYPDDARLVAPIAAAPRLDPQCLAIDAVARRAITADPNWNGGDYYGGDPPTDGLAIARQLGHVMYLSKDSMERKFGRRAAGRDARRDSFPTDRAADFFPYRDVESYLDYQAEKFVDRFDANAYLYLTRAMDDYDLSEGYESDAAALAAFEGEALVMSFTADWHFTVEQSAALADAFREAGAPVAHHVVRSDHGHDAFLVEPNKVGPPIRDFLAEGTDGRAVTDARDRDRGPDRRPPGADGDGTDGRPGRRLERLGPRHRP